MLPLKIWLQAPWRRANARARAELRETQTLMRRAGSGLSAESRTMLQDSLAHVRLARAQGHVEMLEAATDRLVNQQQRFLLSYRRSGWLESVESMGYAILIALVLRALVVEAFKIPSGSMIPTLAIGDQIFVNKYLYGPRVPFTSYRPLHFAAPKRGEVVVFVCPVEPNDDYIKRIIGLAGDEIAVRDGTIYVNGKAIERQATGEVTHWDKDVTGTHWRAFAARAFTETVDGHTYVALEDADMRRRAADFGPHTVPAGHVFMMGDNRDHSYDSRAWGPVPVDNILGRAMFVWWSWGEQGPRWQRLGSRVQ